MGYDQILEQVEGLDFIGDRDKADAVTKAVLGMLASRLDDDKARRFTAALPEPLTYEKLHSHQRRTLNISMDDAIAEIAVQFKLTEMQSRGLILRVLHSTKEAVGAEAFVDVEESLPVDWVGVLQQA